VDIYIEKSIAREPGERFDKKLWKAMQLVMNESVKFVDILHTVPWEDGLPSDIVTGRDFSFTYITVPITVLV